MERYHASINYFIPRKWRSKNIGWWLTGVVITSCLFISTKAYVTIESKFPKVGPDHLAHYLADFNNYRLLLPDIQTWMLEDEDSNLTSWRYTVRYGCGPECWGRVVLTLQQDAAAVAAAAAQRRRTTTVPNHLVFLHVKCRRSIPFIWDFCEEWASVATISRGINDQPVSMYKEHSWRKCSIFSYIVGRCFAELRAARRDFIQSLTLLMSEEHQK